ncbi:MULTISPECIES: hypothetical protein [unclassified Streptomyces]
MRPPRERDERDAGHGQVAGADAPALGATRFETARLDERGEVPGAA